MSTQSYFVQAVLPDISVEVIECIHGVLQKKITVDTFSNLFSVSSTQEELLSECRTAYDTFIQIVDGAAELKIKDKRYHLSLGEGIMLPAKVSYCFMTSKAFTMIATTVNHEKYK